MKELKVDQITLLDDVETREAKCIYRERTAAAAWSYRLPLILLVLVTVGAVVAIWQQIIWLLGVLAAVAVVCIFAAFSGVRTYHKVVETYADLIRVARKNDQIRHEERLRQRERERLQDGVVVKHIYQIDDIKRTMTHAGFYQPFPKPVPTTPTPAAQPAKAAPTKGKAAAKPTTRKSSRR